MSSEAQKGVDQPIEIFYSYASQDEPLRNELEKHLDILQRRGLITNWHNRKIGAGQERALEIEKHLNAAQIILLLVSPDFLASEYCYGSEVQHALERHRIHEARVIPVLFRPIDWENSPFFELQSLPPNLKPVTSWSGRNGRDKAFVEITKGIRAAVEALFVQKSLVLQNTPEQWIQLGDVHFQSCRYHDALEAYEKALSANPHDATAYLGKGNVFARLRRNRADVEQALVAFERAIRLDPQNPTALLRKGDMLWRHYHYKKALLATEQAISLNSNFIEAHLQKANILEDCDNNNVDHILEHVLTLCREALQRNPRDVTAHLYQGIALYCLKRFEESLQVCEQILRLDTHFLRGYTLQSTLHSELGQYSKALADAEMLIQRDPEVFVHYNRKGHVLMKLDRHDEALASYEEAIRLAPDNGVAYAAKGKILLHKERLAFEAAQQLSLNEPE